MHGFSIIDASNKKWHRNKKKIDYKLQEKHQEDRFIFYNGLLQTVLNTVGYP